jgi:hypothetical protein
MSMTVVKFTYYCCEDAKLLVIILKLSNVVARLPTFVTFAYFSDIELLCSGKQLRNTGMLTSMYRYAT